MWVALSAATKIALVNAGKILMVLAPVAAATANYFASNKSKKGRK